MPPSPLTPTKIGAETLVNNFLANRQEGSTVTALTDGGYVIAWWSQNQPGDDGLGVRAQRFNADGSPAGAEFHVNTTVADNQAGAKVVAGAGGGFTVLWTGWTGDARTGTNDIYGQRFDAAGNALGGEFTIATRTDRHEQNVDVVALRDGSFVVAWDSVDAGGSNARIEMAQRFDAGWNALGSAFAASPSFQLDGGSAVHTQDPAALTALNNGRLVSVWTQAMPGDTSTDIWAQILTPSGTPSGAAFRVNAEVAGAQGQPDVATLKDGSFVVTYWSGFEGGTVFQRFAASGRKLGGEVRVDNTPNGAVTPHITALADGGFVIAWQGGADGDGSAVSAQRFAADGSALGDNFLLDGNVTLWQSQPDLAQLANGRLVASFTSEAYGNATDIAAQQFRLLPQALPKASPFGVVKVTASDVNFGDSAFAGLSGLTQVNNSGSGDLSYVLAADAEAAFGGGPIKLASGANADTFHVFALGLSAGTSTIYTLDHGVALIDGGDGDDTFRMNASTWGASGLHIDGNGGTNKVMLSFSGTVSDGDFAGLARITELDLMAGSNASITLGANAAVAFTGGAVKLLAKAGATISVDGHALAAGFTATGADGNDSFIGGAGTDVLKGGAGADVFYLGQGGVDRILDFTPGQDVIDLTAAGTVHSLADIAMRMAGSDAVLSFAGQSIRLKGVDFHSLSAGDFIFT